MIAPRIEEQYVGGIRVLTLKTAINGVVQVVGSFRSNPDFGAGHDLVQDVMVSLLDQGTRHRDRFEMASLLERRGSERKYSSDNLRISFQARMLTDELPTVLSIVAEEMRAPAFDETEFDKTRARIRAGLQRSMESTSSRASAALTRLMVPEDHPVFVPAYADDIRALESLTPAQIATYYAEHVGANDLVLVAVGDIDHSTFVAAVETHLGDWATHNVANPTFASTCRPTAQEAIETVPGKANLDVVWGHVLPLRRTDPDFLPLFLGVYGLGGNFSARLMARVRDEQGLTYGTYARLGGVSTQHDMFWKVGITLSPEHYARGLTAVMHEIETFIRDGLTSEEVAEKVETVVGSFQVGLATTSGLAHAIHQVAARSFPLSFLDTYPDEVAALTASSVNRAVATHLSAADLCSVSAGVVPTA